jgi:hypothetical protein
LCVRALNPRARRPQGTLKGYDQTTNVILTNAQERVFSLNDGVVVVPLGLYIIRGDNMCGRVQGSRVAEVPLPPSPLSLSPVVAWFCGY